MAVISANFNLLGKLQFNTASHHILFSVGLQISNVCFKCFDGILLKVVAYFVSKDLISFSIWVKSVCENKNFCKLGETFPLITRMLG